MRGATALACREGEWASVALERWIDPSEAQLSTPRRVSGGLLGLRPTNPPLESPEAIPPPYKPTPLPTPRATTRRPRRLPRRGQCP